MPKRARTSSDVSSASSYPSTVVYYQGGGRRRYKRMPSMVARGYKLYKRPSMPLYPFKRTCRVVLATNTSTGFIDAFTDREIAWSFALDEVTLWYVNAAASQSYVISGMSVLATINHILSQGSLISLLCSISGVSTVLI